MPQKFPGSAMFFGIAFVICNIVTNVSFVSVGVATLASKWRPMCIRIHYASDTDHGFFHTFCATHTRLFNNVVVIIRNEEEAIGTCRNDILTVFFYIDLLFT